MQILKPGICLDAFFQQIRAAVRRLLLVDYDGTLSRFQAERFQAFPYPQVPSLLDRIAKDRATRLVVVSGRRAREIQPLMQLRRPIEIWGAHGHEHLRVDGSCQVTKAARAGARILFQAAEALEREGLGGSLEMKPGAVALHWRGLSWSAMHEIRVCGYRAWSLFAQNRDMQLLEFDGGLELRVCRPNKGDTVEALLARSKDTACAYLGDDISDEDAFAAMNGRGISVLVRPQRRSTNADVWLQPPAELVGFLKRWISACGG